MELKLRPATEADIPAIHALETRVFPDPWPLEAFGNLPGEYTWVLEADGAIYAYIIYLVVLDEAMIINFGVDPRHQRQGLGRRLLKETMNILIERGYLYFYLDVRESNLPAIHLYRSMGFCSLGSRKQYYQNPPEDSVVMGLYLAAEEVKGGI